MFFIIALLWISISSPVWFIGTILYLILFAIINLLKIIFSFLLLIINLLNGLNTEYVLQNFLYSVISAIIDLFKRYDDLFYFFWNFGNNHPFWSIIFSIILLFIYYVYPSD